MTVEGVPTASVAVAYADMCGLELPIFRYTIYRRGEGLELPIFR
jgi:hypothetical protein